MEDIAEHGKKYGFLIIIVGLSKYKTIIRDQKNMLNKPEDLGRYGNSITAMDTTFARKKKEKTHTRKEKSMRNT